MLSSSPSGQSFISFLVISFNPSKLKFRTPGDNSNLFILFYDFSITLF
nr:MAG TPA: hypothetical protein [Caudoviricetes sp.]